MTVNNENNNTNIIGLTLIILLIFSYLQIYLATYLNDMLDGYQGLQIPGGDVSEPWFVMFHAGAMFISSVASLIIYEKTKNKGSSLKRASFVLIPYLLPLWSAQDWIFSAAKESPYSDNYFSSASEQAAWISVVLVTFFLVFQATVPHWMDIIFRKNGPQK
ncbi:MAG: hypothetical protein EX271_11735 [Acidimicrobiales bacterium]|nr:hypothetical protein [Hyphomonadaceae bacterium]RZV37176.1 MAG: hypothetical protein EX271_11735 [Acidimicrobiales bacterium]